MKNKNEFINNLIVFNSLLDDLPEDYTREKRPAEEKSNLGINNFKFTIAFPKAIGIYKILTQRIIALNLKIYLSMIDRWKAILDSCEEAAIIFFRAMPSCEFIGFAFVEDKSV
jgi:hypothetical protein